jgi:hypothetical protein
VKLTIEQLVRAAERQGWDVPETRDGWQFRPADPTQTPYSVHRQTPEYTLKKVLAQLKRRGLQWPEER